MNAPTIASLFSRPMRELTDEEFRARNRHACTFSYPGTYGHECGRMATTAGRIDNPTAATESGIYWARRCPECAKVRGLENSDITHWEPFDAQRHRNVFL